MKLSSLYPVVTSIGVCTCFVQKGTMLQSTLLHGTLLKYILDALKFIYIEVSRCACVVP